MRKLVFCLVAGLGWIPRAGWAQSPALTAATFKASICFQGFTTPLTSDLPPTGPGPCATVSQDVLSGYQAALWTIVQAAAPEIQNFFATKTVKIFIIPPRIPSSTAAVEGVNTMGWGAWSGNSVYVGISQLAFDLTYTLPVHKTAELLQLFWAPQTGMQQYDPSVMPHFTATTMQPNATLSSNQLAIYAILAHEIAHYWNGQGDGYKNASSGTSDLNIPTSASYCAGGQTLASANTFPEFSWTDYVPEPSGYDPPWTQAGIWGCSYGNTVTTGLQTSLRDNLPSTPGGIQVWPSDQVVALLKAVYGAPANPSNFPSALAATSPEEDFVESYTMFALFRAGLQSLCLVMPTGSAGSITNLTYDVMISLFGSGAAPFTTSKVAWFQSELPSVVNNGIAFPALPTYPTTSGCQ